MGKEILVITFLSPNCPLCINYTKTLMSVQNEFVEEDVKFMVVFAGPYQDEKEIYDFQNEYKLSMQGILDPDYRLTKALKATVTPEVFVVSKTGIIAYSGAIDNWAYETGKKRAVVTSHFLRNAISKLVNDSVPEPSQTEPVGCYIEI